MNVPYADLRKARRDRNYWRNMFWLMAVAWALGTQTDHYHWSRLSAVIIMVVYVAIGCLHAYAQRRVDEDRDKELGL